MELTAETKSACRGAKGELLDHWQLRCVCKDHIGIDRIWSPHEGKSAEGCTGRCLDLSPPNSAFQSWTHLESPEELRNTDNSFPLSRILAKFYTWSVARAILKLPEWCVQPGCIGRSFWVSCDTPCICGDQESSDPCSSWCGSWKGYGFSCPPNTHNVSPQSYGSDGTNVTTGAMP